ncbi:MAG TPA: hypothetical protein VEG26_10210 [Steroidobacteraceae bacterium]|nr:hypothetical protein [Steroidobacteraceae bacterium]
MQRYCVRGAGVLCFLLAWSAALSARTEPETWAYAYRNIDVTAVGSSAYAVNLARYCVRLDDMLTRILGIKTTYRAPTHLYALTGTQLKPYVGSESQVSYRTGGGSVTVLFASTAAAANNYWGAYFGYTATLLASDRLLSGPDWYMIGVPMVFASTTYEGHRVTLGGVDESAAITLTKAALIPMRSFLALSQEEAAKKGDLYSALYQAQSWFVAHQIYVEGRHRAEFVKYLELMRNGTAEADAFAASLTVTYEQLDKELASAFHQRPYVYTMDAPDDAGARGTATTPLSVPEMKARLALLSVRYGKGPDPVQLAREALRADAGNQTALLALAMAQLKQGALRESLAAIDQVTLSAGCNYCTEVGLVLADLANAAASGSPDPSLDAATLRQRARDDFQRALAADTEDRRARRGLDKLEGSP